MNWQTYDYLKKTAEKSKKVKLNSLDVCELIKLSLNAGEIICARRVCNSEGIEFVKPEED